MTIRQILNDSYDRIGQRETIQRAQVLLCGIARQFALRWPLSRLQRNILDQIESGHAVSERDAARTYFAEESAISTLVGWIGLACNPHAFWANHWIIYALFRVVELRTIADAGFVRESNPGWEAAYIRRTAELAQSLRGALAMLQAEAACR